MNDRRVITTAESFSDILERLICHITAQIHDDLARKYEFLASFLTDEIERSDAEMLRNYINNELRRHFTGCIRRDQIFQCFLGKLKIDLLII